MDAQGADVVRGFTESAGATYTTAVDRAQGLWELYGFDVVPNGFLVDEQGIVRYAKVGGFDARNAEDVAAIETLIAGPAAAKAGAAPKFEGVADALRKAEEESKRDPKNLDKLLALAERRVEAKQYAAAERDFTAVLAQKKSAPALVGLASIYFDRGDRAKAASALQRAREIEPDNWIIRKQIWAVEHPEEFYPTINTDWQKKRIEQEDAAKK